MQISTPCKRACTNDQIQYSSPFLLLIPLSSLPSLITSSIHHFLFSFIHTSSSVQSYMPYILIKKKSIIQKRINKNSRTPPKLIVEHMSCVCPMNPCHAYPKPMPTPNQSNGIWYRKPFFAVLCSVFVFLSSFGSSSRVALDAW